MQSMKMRGRLFVAASPPDERKGFAFPTSNQIDRRLRLPVAAQPPEVIGRYGKAKPFRSSAGKARRKEGDREIARFRSSAS
jgi:hypothetical protein